MARQAVAAPAAAEAKARFERGIRNFFLISDRYRVHFRREFEHAILSICPETVDSVFSCGRPAADSCTEYCD